jgi:pimeloyl-ACP methyl ester carboxylesterase
MARRGKRTVVRAVMGLLGLVAGCLLVVRPFTSESLMVVAVVVGLLIAGVSELIEGTRDAPARSVLGSTYLLGAAVVALWTGPSVRLTAAVVGVLLIAAGALEIWSGLLSRVELPALLVAAAAGGPSVALFTGVATTGIGAVVLLWADPVVLTMVIGLGARLLLVGVGLLVDIWYPSTGYGRSTERLRAVWRVIALAMAALLATVGNLTLAAGVPSAVYYRDIATTSPAGVLLGATPSADTSAGATGIQLLYTTSDERDDTVTASARLYVPSSTSGDALPLVVWAHPESGTGQGCAPSVRGESVGGLVDVDDILARGYAVLAPDYPGLGAPGSASVLLGVAEGRAILDAIRAVAQVPGIRLGRTVLWGFSQGGHAALWAAQLAPSYAPDVTLSAVVADEPVANPAAVLNHLVQVGSDDALVDEVLYSYAEGYPDVRLADYLSLPAQLVTEEVATGCGSVSPAAAALQTLGGDARRWLQPPSQGPLAARLDQNTPARRLSVPLLVLQGGADEIVPQSLQDAEVATRCRAGSVVDYRVYPGVRHANSAMESGRRSEILAWISDRVTGKDAPNICA